MILDGSEVRGRKSEERDVKSHHSLKAPSLLINFRP